MPALKTVVTATTKKVVKLSPKVKLKLMTKLQSYAQKKAQRDKLNIEMNGKKDKKTGKFLVEGIQQEVELLMEELGEDKLAIDGFTTTIIAPVVRGKFNAKKAIAIGFTTDQIAQCYDEDEPGTSYVKISVPKAKGDDDDE